MEVRPVKKFKRAFWTKENVLSTNAIENSFWNTGEKLGRVTRFRAETDQATRWLAYALTEVEKGFRRISGYADLSKLVDALRKI